jgi:hypothetical protein
MSLPTCEKLVANDFHYLHEDDAYQATYVIKQDTQQLCDFIYNYVGADCWAVTIGETIIYNCYDKNIKSDPDSYCRFLNFSRNSILSDPHTLLNFVNNSGVDTYIDIYMFNANCWKIRLNYTQHNQTYTCSVFDKTQ